MIPAIWDEKPCFPEGFDKVVSLTTGRELTDDLPPNYFLNIPADFVSPTFHPSSLTKRGTRQRRYRIRRRLTPVQDALEKTKSQGDVELVHLMMSLYVKNPLQSLSIGCKSVFRVSGPHPQSHQA